MVPFVAETVTVSPIDPAPMPTAGVMSDVVLSVDDPPSSELSSRSGFNGLLGGVVSITIVSGEEFPDALFCVSTRLVVMVHEPSVKVSKSQLETLAEARYVQVTTVGPLLAVTVTVSPSVTPVERTSGVVSFVMLSVDELPVSDDVIKLGVLGEAMAETSTETVVLVLRLSKS